MRVGVIGVGHLGQHHARILSTLPEVELVAVVDTNRQRAAEIAARTSTRALHEWHQLVGQVDAVTIAAPTEVHAAIAEGMLAQGIHVLIEKPVTVNTAQADDLIRLAGDRRLCLAVGHTERFNPAVIRAKPLIENPRFIEVHRLGTFPERSLDIDVVFDLMIHDLDLVLDMVNDEVTEVQAVGVPVLTPRVDIANVRLRFAGGCIANLTASRISRDRVRKIRFFQRDAYLSVDYAAQELESYRLVHEPNRSTPTITGGKLEVPRQEPLQGELEDFVAAIRERRAPMVSGEQGRAALALAERVIERMEMTA